MTPFIYYLVKNTLVLLVLSIVTLCFDYAKIRVVVEDRISALIALIAGTRFAINNFRKTFGLYLLLTLFGLGLLVLYAVVEQQIVQQSFSGVLLAMVVGQLFMLARFWLKASFYASQTALYRQAVRSHHTV
jgi:hypothetical protein